MQEYHVDESKKDNSYDIVVSIVCLSYNNGKYIRNALDSFLNQKISFPFEIIIHDDASQDDSQDIIREYHKRYPEVIHPILQSENKMSSITISGIIKNYIEPLVKGKYIAFCEADDYWVDNYKLEQQIEFLEKNNDYVGCFGRTKIFNNKTSSFEGEIRLNTIDCDYTFEDAIKNRCHYSTLVVTSSVYFNRSNELFKLFDNIDDYPTKVSLLLKGKVYYIDKLFSVYRYMSSVDAWSYKLAAKSNPLLVHALNRIKMCKFLLSVVIDKRMQIVLKACIKDDYWNIYNITNDCHYLSELGYRRHILNVKIKAAILKIIRNRKL